MKTLYTFTDLWIKRRLRNPGSMMTSLIIPLAVLLGIGFWGDRQSIGPTVLKIVGFMVMMDGLAALVSIAEFREHAVLRVLHTTRLSRGIFSLGYVLNQMLFSVATSILFVVVASVFFGARYEGNLLLAVLLLALGNFTFTSIGLAASASMPSSFAIAFAAWPIVLAPFVVLSGIFFPLKGALLGMARVLPSYSLLDGLQQVASGVAGMNSVGVSLIVLAVWGGVSFFIAARALRWD